MVNHFQIKVKNKIQINFIKYFNLVNETIIKYKYFISANIFISTSSLKSSIVKKLFIDLNQCDSI